jgi:hypothetical protein
MDYLLAAAGALVVLCAMTDYDFFMHMLPMQALVSLFRRKRAGFCGVRVGSALAVMGTPRTSQE